MNEPNDFDPIDRFLEGDFASTPSEELRGRLLKRTGGVLRRRRRLRQGALIAALVVCYVGGLASARWFEHPKVNEQQIAQHPQPPDTKALPTEKPPPKPEPRQLAQKASPSDLEWQALDDPKKRWELYRQAGDLYLTADGDLQNAVRCYRAALAAATQSEMLVSANDTWLLMALKEAKLKERDHGSTSD